MSGARETPDPFAGYTPVKVAPIAGADPGPRTPVAEKRPRKYRFGTKREGGVSRTVKFFGLVLVSLVLLALIAVLAYGFIYERPVDEPFLGDGTPTNCVQRLAELGCEARGRVRAALSSGGEPSAERPSDTNGASFAEKAFPALRTFLGRNDRMKKSVRSLEGEAEPESAEAAPTNVAVSVKRRVVDPALKRFKGGRTGRTIESGGQR